MRGDKCDWEWGSGGAGGGGHTLCTSYGGEIKYP